MHSPGEDPLSVLRGDTVLAEPGSGLTGLVDHRAGPRSARAGRSCCRSRRSNRPAYRPETLSPTETSNSDMWLYDVTVPSACRIFTWRPYAPSKAAWMTSPAITARIGVPNAAAKSRPVWLLRPAAAGLVEVSGQVVAGGRQDDPGRGPRLGGRRGLGAAAFAAAAALAATAALRAASCLAAASAWARRWVRFALAASFAARAFATAAASACALRVDSSDSSNRDRSRDASSRRSIRAAVIESSVCELAVVPAVPAVAGPAVGDRATALVPAAAARAAVRPTSWTPRTEERRVRRCFATRRAPAGVRRGVVRPASDTSW